MPTLPSCLPPAIVLAFALCWLPAQTQTQTFPIRAAGPSEPELVTEGEQPLAVGPAYKAMFDEGGVAFVPRFGKAAARNFPVRYELMGIGRGDVLAPVGPAERTCGTLRVDYMRPGLVERYDVLAAGLEQSFVLDELPAGTGDLVVRGRLTTDLQVAPFADGLQFTLPLVGSCTLGAVTVIDAAGQRVAGAVHYHDGLVDYVVPADFVATAQLPLVIDPLFGNTLTVVAAAVSEQNADVAFDATNGVYLVVYEFLFSATDTDIYAQRVSSSGVLIGPPMILEGSGANDLAPQVASVNAADRFVAVWNRQIASQGDVLGRTVDAATGVSGPFLAIASGADTQVSVDIGGAANTVDQHAICVWHNATIAQVEAVQLVVNPDGSMFTQDLTTLSAGSAIEPHISKSGGAAGRYLVTWRTNYGNGDFDPEGSIVDRDLTVLASGLSFDSAVNFTTNVDVDGDGNNWVVAWQTRESTTLQHDVFARTVHFVSPGSFALGSGIVTIEATPTSDEIRPHVCWTGDASLVSYQISALPGVGATYVRSIDSFSCADCEGRSRVVTSLSDDYAIVGASRRSGGDAVDEALFVQERRTGGGAADLLAQLWSGVDGRSQVVQASCGSRGGTTYANCALAGYAGFTMRCVDAEPNTTAILVLSRSQSPIVCGACRLVPDPYTGFVLFTNTNASGDASFAVAIPGNVAALGLDFYMQWIIVEPVTPGCYLLGSDLSTALSTRIE